MELYSGMPYWIAKNPLYDYFNPLSGDHHTDVVIIGSGITGTLIAHELCEAGIECCIVDKRAPCTGSSAASTAFLQYEIDMPLYKLAKKVGEENALLAYRCCLKAIYDIEKVFREIGSNPDFQWLSSIFFASNKEGAEIITKEYEMREKHGFPVTFLTGKEVKERFGFEPPCAMTNDVSAQLDDYLAAVTLIDYHMKKHGLKIYTPTQVTACKRKGSGFEVLTDKRHKIRCSHVVIAAGFEAGQFLPMQVMRLSSTYVIMSEPVEPGYIWPERSLIWETHFPYVYLRTTKNNRIIVGGEDEDFRDPVKRDELLRAKISRLEKKFRKLFPRIPFKTDMAWCGTFSSTADSLPFIGEWPGHPGMHYALGYGGNGITFSMNAAQMIRKSIMGKKDERHEAFGFERILK